ncbi:MAG: alpha-L-rhamnosidase N-terminal domain-containing protein [Bacteroidaceae bacterium]|nr:alpha-L-rhamnosidase N-terminal domain-containing protein [Bacteroidaceae bacterium]
MINLRFFLIAIFLCATTIIPLHTYAKGTRATITPVSLTCEYEQSPLLDIQNPRFAWVNKNKKQRKGAAQSAYRIRVAEAADRLDAPLWDTGKISSQNSAFIAYTGPTLKSRTSYWWQVKVWDEKGRESEWSEPASWHMGILSSDEWKGKWIGAPWQDEESYDVSGSNEFQPAPLLRREFNVEKPIKEARFYGTGLGYFELYINGERVGEDYLSPNQTNYDKRPTLNTRGIVVTDPFKEYTVMYLSHDLTPMLGEGKNAVGVILGNGFYDITTHWVLGYGTPRFMGQIEIIYENGTQQIIASDEDWRIERSAIVSDQIYLGEHYDARLEHDGWNKPGYDDSSWAKAALKRAPYGKLIPQNGPADRINERFAPQSIEKSENGTIRVKFPVEISGWVALKNINATRGQKISIKYLSESPGNGANTYTAKGSGNESYHARFTWFVFSEVEIIGLDSLATSQIEAHAVNSNVKRSGNFATSNELINTINKIWQRSQLDNMHGSIASDCPHRERSAYTGDGQVACVTVMHNFDARTFYNKWIRDIRGSQTADGYVPNGAPWQPGCGGGVGWGAAMEIMPWKFYRHYGDERLLEQNFEAMCNHVRWMTTWVNKETGIMHSQDPNPWKNLGDWLPPHQLPRNELVHTFFLWMCADIAASTAEKLGRTAEAEEFTQLRDRTAAAFHKEFYDPSTGSYGKHGSNVLALKIGVPADRKAKVIEALRANIAEVNDHLDTGIVGTRYLFEVLCDNGLKELAYKIINQRDFPSFGWWIEQGATTTWEQWDGGNSHNHPMFGGGIGWFYSRLAGLRLKDIGFRAFDVKPIIPEGLEWVNYSHNTTYGTIDIKWQLSKGRFTLECEVPVGTTATIWVPYSNAAPKVKNSKFVKAKGTRDGYALYEVASGKYKFTSKM